MKPKKLNGRLLNGPMVLELCKAYTESINKGNVPSINSAWCNLCRSENQRSLEDAIRSFESGLLKK